MFRAAAALGLLILFSFPSVGFATTILFQVTDVADSIPGEDLWTYDYFVSGFGFDTDIGFSVEFDVGLYSQLEDPPPGVGSDWDIIAFQPDSLLLDAGLYDALALVDGRRWRCDSVSALGGWVLSGLRPESRLSKSTNSMETALSLGRSSSDRPRFPSRPPRC